ncbi:hypothetical protein FJZ22_02255 [Candidatus Pacearchaeota archaeon]|nr:hypothetical protein [Candidatus Pacearchaeota archaeon]
MDLTYQALKKITIGIMGLTLLLIGGILLLIPGPGIPIIIMGLILLASEFLWARSLIKKYNLHIKKDGVTIKINSKDHLGTYKRG